MTATLRKRISSTNEITVALRVIQSEQASGALIITASQGEASLSLRNGRITAAAVSPTGERGQEALDKVRTLQPVKLRYLKYAAHSSGRIADLPIEDFLVRLEAPPVERCQQETVQAIAPKPEVEKSVVAVPMAVTPPSRPVLRSQRANPLVKELFAMVCGIVVLAGVAKWVPNLIESTAGSGGFERLASKRLQQNFHHTIAADSLLESFVLRPNQFHEHRPISLVAHVGTEPMTEDLRFGRYLVAKGNHEKARQYFENYLRMFPFAIKPRLELANIYLATGQSHDARLLCLRTLKRQLTPAEIGDVWKILSQCQTK
jgi:hypothetical protein